MFKQILVPLENSPTDKVILDHIRPLAKLTKATLILVHVADGFAARFQDQLNLADSEEIRKDRSYLDVCRKKLGEEGFQVNTHLVRGDPTEQILVIAEKEQCDLIAMSTHGHRFIKDFLLGSVAEGIRHRTSIPILMIRAPQ